MSIQVSEQAAIRIWSLLWLVCTCGGSIGTLIANTYPNSGTAKLLSTIFAAVGLLGAAAQAQSKPLVKQLPPPER